MIYGVLQLNQVICKLEEVFGHLRTFLVHFIDPLPAGRVLHIRRQLLLFVRFDRALQFQHVLHQFVTDLRLLLAIESLFCSVRILVAGSTLRIDV